MSRYLIGAAAVMLLAGAAYVGFQAGETANPGPAEKVGQEIDEGLNDAARAVEDATD